ncbi:hypothetical protein [Streptomyces avicenniae]|uniref:hypothetical protein n=1 Tax=Streptomyces avicenniae TaxID=500153 RepID=UPI00167E0751|nr:hypothetical protein [Streptomyces avicenniae]
MSSISAHATTTTGRIAVRRTRHLLSGALRAVRVMAGTAVEVAVLGRVDGEPGLVRQPR